MIPDFVRERKINIKAININYSFYMGCVVGIYGGTLCRLWVVEKPQIHMLQVAPLMLNRCTLTECLCVLDTPVNTAMGVPITDPMMLSWRWDMIKSLRLDTTEVVTTHA